jgi:predicted PurR-regulated permease PerM
MSNNKWNKNYIRIGITFTVSICSCILFAEIIQHWSGIFSVIGRFFSALTPVIIGIVLAFLVNPLMLYARKGLSFIIFKISYGKKKRAELQLTSEQESDRYDEIYRKTKIPGLIISFLVFLGILVGFLWLLIPNIYMSLQQLVEDIPRYRKELQEWVNKMFSKNDVLEGRLTQIIDHVGEAVMDIFDKKIMPNMDTIVLKISSGVVVGIKAVFNFLIGLIVMIYLLASKEVLIAQGKKFIYCIFSKKHGNKIMSGLGYANTVFGGFINGKILDSFIIGIICFVFTKAMGMTYAVLISVIVGVTNIIPFFGPFIGAVPGALLALMDDPLMLVIFVVFVICLQQFDGNILGPIILGDSTGLSGMWVLFAILVAGDLFGVAGMILGVPVFACIYAFVAVWLRDSLRGKNLSSRTEDYFRLTGFDEKTGEPMYRSKHEERITARQRKRKKHKHFLMMQKEEEKAADAESDNKSNEKSDNNEQ